MSWFTDLAGKAESLLEKVDNTAANVLQVDEKKVQSDSRTESSDQLGSDVGLHPAEFGESRITRTASEGSLLRLGPSAPVKSRLQSSIPRQQPKPLKKEDENDDQLFKFLNSNVSSSKEKTSSKESPGLTRKTSEPKIFVKVDKKKSEDLMVASIAKDGTELTEASDLTRDIDGVEEPSVQSMDHIPASQLAPAVNQTDNNRESNIELENKLLRKEITSLNEEMVSKLQRVKESEKRMQYAEQQLAKSQQQLIATESIVRHLRATEDDLNQALAAKDSQLAVLRVRIQQADQELQEKKSQIDKFNVEREQLLQDHTDSSGVHNHALEVVQAKLEEAERKLKTEKETSHNVQHESLERQSRLEEDQHAMAESMRSLQKKVSEERSKANDQASALKIAKANLEAARQEMKDYKEKAGRILQAKDKVISTLREGREGDLCVGGITSAEYDEVSQERDAFREELSQLRFRIEQLKAELQDMEHHHQTDAYIQQEKLDVMQGLLDDEKRKREACEEEIRTQMQDVRFAHEEGQRNKTSLMNQIQDKVNEIQRLKNQLATKPLTATNEVELENRVRALTENLIQKQTVIESLSTEKNSLVLQLERLEQQYRDVQASSTNHMNTTAISLDSTDDSDENTLSRVKSITSVMPTKLNESRQVKQAVNEIDKCRYVSGRERCIFSNFQIDTS